MATKTTQKTINETYVTKLNEVMKDLDFKIQNDVNYIEPELRKLENIAKFLRRNNPQF